MPRQHGMATGLQAQCSVAFEKLRFKLHMTCSCLTSVHISRTFSRIMLQWRSKALTRASSFRLFL